MLPLNKDTYQVQLHATVIRAGTTATPTKELY